MIRKVIVGAVFAGVIGLGSSVLAQQAPQEKPKETKASASEADAPQKSARPKRDRSDGPITFEKWVERAMAPLVVPRESVVFLGEGYAYPHPATPWKMRIIAEDEETVTLQQLPPEDPESMLHRMWRRKEADELQAQFDLMVNPKSRTVDFYAEIIPLPTVDSINYELVEAGLPEDGLWQIGFAVADMNADGIDDLVAPSQRKGRGRPWIFLGKGDGTFNVWRAAKWSTKVPYEYGNVAIADLDKDGHQDVVFALHLRNQYVCYGNSKGDFTRSERLPSRDPRLFSRAVDVGDFNADGWPDLVFVAEIAIEMSTGRQLPARSTWILENLEGKGWRIQDEEFSKRMMADQIVALDIDGDQKDDILHPSNMLGWRVPLTLNRTNGDSWDFRAVTPENVLSDTLHHEIALLRSPEGTDKPGAFVATFAQGAMVPDLTGESKAERKTRSGFVVYELEKNEEGGYQLEAIPEVISPGTFNYWKLASGDLNNDGLTDIVAAAKVGPIDVYLQQPDGSWVQERSEEFDTAKMGTPYDIELNDFDGDGVLDILMMGATTADGIPGGFRLWKGSLENR